MEMTLLNLVEGIYLIPAATSHQKVKTWKRHLYDQIQDKDRIPTITPLSHVVVVALAQQDRKSKK